MEAFGIGFFIFILGMFNLALFRVNVVLGVIISLFLTAFWL